LAVAVPDDEAGGSFFDRPERRETAFTCHGSASKTIVATTTKTTISRASIIAPVMIGLDCSLSESRPIAADPGRMTLK
jgi:hypothetical protein